jgi:hypothetical protein
MLKSVGSNIKLTSEQILQLEEWKDRLNVIQDEIKKTEPILEGLRTSIESASKYKISLEKTSSHLEEKVQNLEIKRNSLSEEIKESSKVLANHSIEMNERLQILSSREEEDRVRAQHINEAHEMLSQRENGHKTREQILSERELLVEKAAQALLEATKYVTWN